ncbi:MAG TPA: DM9 repeat-containing protein [Alphaproteobacteria bacterium]|jgi:hypothetical protein
MTKLLSAIAAVTSIGVALACLPAAAQTPAQNATAATLAALNGPAATEPLVIWQAAVPNAAIPPNAIPGGQEQGRPLALCGASYMGARYVGKAMGNGCVFGVSGREVSAAQYDLLLGNPALLTQNPQFVRWVPSQSGLVPPGAFMAAREGENVLPVCRAGYQGSVQPGKLVGPACKVVYGGQEVALPQYEVLVVSRIGTEIPTAVLSAAATNPAAPSPVAASPAARGIAINGVGGITSMDIQGMDLESAMMAIQSQRSELLENQLRDQIASVQARNNDIAKLNVQISDLTTERAKLPAPNSMSAADKTKAAQLDGQIQQLKGKIDALSNSQQMDMLRMQSLTNKRNEAFDLMTNFIKKMQDSRSSIIGNMR